MSPADLPDLARRLRDAELYCRPVPPLTTLWPDLTVEDAYEIQRLNAAARLSGGESLLGHKIGLTAAVMQELFGVDEPDYGHLFAPMFLAPERPVDLSDLIDPQIEVEPAFVLAEPLAGPGVSVPQVLAATEWVIPAFEVIDSRIDEWAIRLQDTIADNGSSARVVLGEARKRPSELPLASMDTTLYLDDVVAEHGNSSAVLGHPAAGVAWLANALSGFGVRLEAGQVVLPGTCTRSRRIATHDSATGAIEGLGEVHVSFTGKPLVVRA